MDWEDTKDLEEVEGSVAMLYGERDGRNKKSNGNWTGRIQHTAGSLGRARQELESWMQGDRHLQTPPVHLDARPPGREDDPRDSLCIRALDVICPKRQISRDSRIERRT